MDSQILRLLIFSLLVTVSFCSSNLATPLAEFQGNLPVYPGAQVLDTVVLFTGYPGLAQIEVQAASSILICVSPYAAVLSSLQAQCPNPISVKYSSPSPVNEFLLFLDDFSMNFLGQDQKAQNQNKNLEELQVPPYTPLSFQVPLLQDTPYYISIGLAEDVGSNETLRFVEDFVLVNQYPKCETGVPNVSYNGTIGTEPCEEVASSLAKGNQSSPALSVSKINPVLFSFEVGTENLATAAQLDFHINERTYSFTIYVGFEFIPSPTTPNTLVFSNSSSEALFDESYFLGDIVQTYSIVIPNPKQGTYYALVTSNLENLNTSFMIEYNLTTCSIAHNTCDSYNITTYPASDMNVTNIIISNVMQYVAVIGDSATFGIDVNGTGGTVFIQMDINAFPSDTAPYSFYNYDASSTLTLSYGNGSTDQENFVFGLLNKDSLSQDSFTALVWTGSACPGNCSSQGTCDSATTQCSCDKDFEGRYCQTKTSSSHKKLSTLYIILIIIGGAILLAILIGVPVALFLNNRKKARYERV